jgi:hypothetical protein
MVRRLALDRYTALIVRFGLAATSVVSGRIAVPAARSAAKEQTNQPRATTGYQASPWLVLILFVAGAFPVLAQTSSAPTVSIRRNTALNGPVLAADFNGDGIVDVVAQDAAQTSAAQIVVAIGNGDGTFKTPVRTGFSGEAQAIGDFNNDGNADVVIAAIAQSGAPATVYVLAGRGDGTFTRSSPVAQRAWTYFATPGDVDGDGNQDLVIGGNDGNADGVLVVPGNGDLTFGAPAALTAGAYPNGAAIADLDGDNRKDVAVANHDGHSITIFLHQGGFTFTASDIPLDAQANDVQAADLNRDGKMDLVVAATNDGSDDLFYITGRVYVLNGTGTGAFAQPAKYNTARGAWRLVVGDFTRDGVLDVATANRSAKQDVDFCGFLWDSVSILPGKSGGTFGAASSFSLGNQSNLVDFRYRMTVDSLVAADVNGDRHPDLIASQGAILLTQPADPNWTPQVVNVTATAPDPNDHSIQLQAFASDSDQDLLSWTWTDSKGQWIEPTASPCRFVPQTLGVHTFTITVDDGHGHTASGSVIVDFGASGIGTPPSVTVSAPVAGAILDEGRPFTIQWSATAGNSALAGVSVALSTDDGGHFATISECTTATYTNSCTWNAKPVTNSGRIAVTVTDENGNKGTGTSGRFTIRSASGGTLPYGWSHGDVGNVGSPGSASHDGFVWNGEGLTVSGSGADIWGTADEFHYVWKTMSGDFEIETRVASVQPVNPWTKAGLMIRANQLSTSPHASIFVTPGKGIAFQRRTTGGGISTSTSGAALAAPVWLRMVRQGSTLTAYYKKALPDKWTLLGQQSIAALPATLSVGLAVTSHDDGTLATAKFEGVFVSAVPAWTTTEVGGAAGSASATNATIYTVKGSGADIWGTSDSFTYVWVPINGFVTVTARVLDLTNTNAWAKAGLMVRESLAPGAKHVDAIVTPGKGLAMQMRGATGGTSTTVLQKSGAAPVFLRLTTSISGETGRIVFVQANYSTDGTLWRILGQASVDMNPNAYVGIAVTSHDATVQTTATLDTVRVER